MTPEMLRALRLNPRLRKRLRECQTELLAAVRGGQPEQLQAAAKRWADAEKEAIRGIESKTAASRQHRVVFQIEEPYYQDFCEIAVEHRMSPGEVARRFCVSGHRFHEIFWTNANGGGTLEDLVKTHPGGPTLAQLVLPDFSRRW